MLKCSVNVGVRACVAICVETDDYACPRGRLLPEDIPCTFSGADYGHLRIGVVYLVGPDGHVVAEMLDQDYPGAERVRRYFHTTEGICAGGISEPRQNRECS